MAGYIPKVELHIHFDGACNIESLQDMCRNDGLDVTHFHHDNIEEFKKVVSLIEPQESLVDFLRPFPDVCYILSTEQNLKRQAIEFCKEQYCHNVIYCETRLCPHLFTSRGLLPEQALLAVIKGLEEGQKCHDIKVKIILSLIKSNPEWSIEIAQLAVKHKDNGIVGIDIAGDELQPMDQQHVDAFKIARDGGLHVTVHAGESGPAENVKQAIELLHAERIGHGYHVVNNPEVYQLAKTKGVHFETCLTSSIYTKSSKYETHTIKMFLKDKVNFGLNTDDPGIMNINIVQEFESAQRDLGMTEDQLIETVFNSARSSFLPPNEKQQLLKLLEEKITLYKNRGLKK